MNEAASWFVLTAMAFADIDGQASLNMTMAVQRGETPCGIWRPSEVRPLLQDRHRDPLSTPVMRRWCVPREHDDVCVDWRVRVVRTDDGQMVLTVPGGEHESAREEAPRGDSADALFALAREPEGAWTSGRTCFGTGSPTKIDAPHMCAVVEPDGKPTPIRIGRGAERRCVVIAGRDRGAILNAHGVGGGEGVEFVPVETADGGFPQTVAAGSVRRIGYRLHDRHADLWHVEHVLVGVPYHDD